MEKNKRGIVDQIMMVMILAVVIVIVILVFWAGSMVLPVMVGAGGTLINQMSSSADTTGDSALKNATNTSLSIASSTLGIVETLVYIALVMMFIGYLIMAYYVRSYPFLAFFWVFIIIGLTFLSLFITNSYTTARDTTPLSSYYTTWGGNDLLMSNLPVIVVVVGVFGGIFLFILASKDPESEVNAI